MRPSLRPLPLELGSVVAGKYRIDRVLGTGGMGTVFAAENVDLGRHVAIKVLHHDLARDDDLARRLRQEARAAAAIGHPGIVDVLDLGTTEAGDPFIVMELLDGEPLGARLAGRSRLPPASAVGILVKAVEALAAAHAKGILHRDLKPDNIFLILHPTPAVKLVDFGLSKQQQGEDLSITRSGVVMGTPLYMSPEQARGARDVGPASDMYSIGAILYQTLSGVPPHVARNYNEMLAAVLLHQPTPLEIAVPELPPALTDLVRELLAKDAAARPSAIETANRLRVIERQLDDSKIAFSPTLQPDNVSDDELAGLAAFAATAATPAPMPVATLPPTRSAPMPVVTPPRSAPMPAATPTRSAPMPVATLPPTRSAPMPVATPHPGPLEATVLSIPPLLGETAPSIAGRPSTPSGTQPVSSLDESSISGGPSALGESSIVSRPTTPRVRDIPASPTAAPRKWLWLVVGGLGMVATILVVVLLARGGKRVAIDAAIVDAAALPDAAPAAIDAAVVVDALMVDAAEPDAPPRDAPTTRDAPVPRPPRDAATPTRDATIRTAADAAGGSGDGLDIDTTNPIKPKP